MIDFRYHIVSVTAVFLALGLGVLMGTTFGDRAIVRALEGRVEDLRGRLDTTRGEVSELRAQVGEAEDLLGQVSTWAVRDSLADRELMFVHDGTETQWRSEAEGVILQSGASSVGALVLSEKWRLDLEGAREELELVVQSVTPGFEAEEDPAREVLDLLGRRLLEPTGRALLERLAQARFLATERVDGAPAEWPPPGTLVVVFASSPLGRSPAPGWLESFARGAATVAPTLVVSSEPGGHHAVRLLRDGEAVPSSLSTFDSASDDPTGAGAILALAAAAAGHGGHFGREDGRRFLPEFLSRPEEPEDAPD